MVGTVDGPWMVSIQDLIPILEADPATCDSLAGASIERPGQDTVRIIRVVPRGDNPRFDVSKDGREIRFNPVSLGEGALLVISSSDGLHPKLLSVLLTRDEVEQRANLERLKVEAKQRERELQIQEELGGYVEFQALRKSLNARPDSDPHPSNPLLMILKKIYAGERLSKEDLKFLRGDRQHLIAAIQHEQAFDNGDLWAGSVACSEWRKAGDPGRAIDFTDRALKVDMPHRSKGAIWTSRGGAKRQIRDLEDSERCANRAVELDDRAY